MGRAALEVADIFRDHGPAWRRANQGHLSHAQVKVTGAIEGCRTAALGGHVARCENDDCGHTAIAYNSCRNRHCPKCQGSQAREWLEARRTELLQVPYFHVVFTLPPRIGAIAFQNKAVIYDLLFKASAETLLTIAADPKRLGVRIGFTSVLHTWGSAMTHHPHVHMPCWKHVFDMTPGGGISLDGSRWISSPEDYLLPVPVLSELFRGKMLAMLKAALIATNETGVTFRHKDYRLKGPDRYKTMTLAPAKFIRRFMLHVLPKGFHRIRHYRLLARGPAKSATIERARELIAAAATAEPEKTQQGSDPAPASSADKPAHPCPCCGARMLIIETFEAGCRPRHRPTGSATAIRIDTS